MRKKKTIVEGPLGLRLTEDVARYLDALLKTLPKEQRTIKRKSGVFQSSEFLPGEKADVSWITTDDIDKDGEVVLPEGIDLVQYRANPIVLWNHDNGFPIGKAQWIKPQGNGIKAKTIYATRPESYVGDWQADTVFALVQQGILKGRSIGFIPLDMRSPSQEQIKARPELQKANAIINKAVLFEYSVVSVPCNGSALIEACSKGFSLESLKAIGITPPAAKAIVKKANPMKVLERELAKWKCSPEAIAEQVYHNLINRGKI